MNVREDSGITGLVLGFSLTFRFKTRTPARVRALSVFPQQWSTLEPNSTSVYVKVLKPTFTSM